MSQKKGKTPKHSQFSSPQYTVLTPPVIRDHSLHMSQSQLLLEKPISQRTKTLILPSTPTGFLTTQTFASSPHLDDTQPLSPSASVSSVGSSKIGKELLPETTTTGFPNYDEEEEEDEDEEEDPGLLPPDHFDPLLLQVKGNIHAVSAFSRRAMADGGIVEDLKKKHRSKSAFYVITAEEVTICFSQDTYELDTSIKKRTMWKDDEFDHLRDAHSSLTTEHLYRMCAQQGSAAAEITRVFSKMSRRLQMVNLLRDVASHIDAGEGVPEEILQSLTELGDRDATLEHILSFEKHVLGPGLQVIGECMQSIQEMMEGFFKSASTNMSRTQATASDATRAINTILSGVTGKLDKSTPPEFSGPLNLHQTDQPQSSKYRGFQTRGAPQQQQRPVKMLPTEVKLTFDWLRPSDVSKPNPIRAFVYLNNNRWLAGANQTFAKLTEGRSTYGFVYILYGLPNLFPDTFLDNESPNPVWFLVIVGSRDYLSATASMFTAYTLNLNFEFAAGCQAIFEVDRTRDAGIQTKKAKPTVYRTHGANLMWIMKNTKLPQESRILSCLISVFPYIMTSMRDKVILGSIDTCEISPSWDHSHRMNMTSQDQKRLERILLPLHLLGPAYSSEVRVGRQVTQRMSAAFGLLQIPAVKETEMSDMIKEIGWDNINMTPLMCLALGATLAVIDNLVYDPEATALTLLDPQQVCTLADRGEMVLQIYVQMRMVYSKTHLSTLNFIPTFIEAVSVGSKTSKSIFNADILHFETIRKKVLSCPYLGLKSIQDEIYHTKRMGKLAYAALLYHGRAITEEKAKDEWGDYKVDKVKEHVDPKTDTVKVETFVMAMAEPTLSILATFVQHVSLEEANKMLASRTPLEQSVIYHCLLEKDDPGPWAATRVAQARDKYMLEEGGKLEKYILSVKESVTSYYINRAGSLTTNEERSKNEALRQNCILQLDKHIMAVNKGMYRVNAPGIAQLEKDRVTLQAVADAVSKLREELGQ